MSGAAMSIREQNARRFMAVAATLAVLGVASNLGGDSTLAKLLVAVGVIALIWSLHRFGRLGPEEPMVFAAPEPPESLRKRKKKKRQRPVEGESTPAADPPQEG